MGKRIALLTDNADPLVPLGGYEAGGENVYVYELARSIGRLGWTVDVFTRWSSPKTSQIARMGENVRVIRLPAGPLEFIPKEQLFPYMQAYIDSFMAFKQTHKLDYLLLHGNYYLSAWAAVQIGKQLGIPVVSTFHTLGIVKHRALNSFDPSPDDRIEKEKDVMQGEDRIIATSPVMKDEIVTMYGMPAKKIVVIPGGVNLKRFTPLPQHIARRVLSINPNKIIILYVGRMERRKGIDTLIEAMSFLVQKMPEKRKVMRLLISGGEARKGIGLEGIPEKTEKERLKKLVESLGLKDIVRFTGNIDRENLPFYYASADVTVVPSYYEPFGLVPLESMACGTPVVASNTGGLMYTIKDGKTGSLVSPKDPAGFADKIYELLENATTRKYFRENGIDRVTRMFSWESVGRQMSDFYHDTIIDYFYRHVQRMRSLGLR
jgi:glycosyltransferase involved in cell wall biosynthesis